MKITEINDKLTGKTINIVVETEKSHNIQNIFVLDVKSSKKSNYICIKTGENTSIELPRKTIEKLAMDGSYEDSFKAYRISYKTF